MTVNVNIDNQTIIRIVGVGIAAFLLFRFIAALEQALTLVFISIFLAFALNPPVSYLSRRMTGGSRGWATGLAYLSVVALIAGFLWALIPPLVSETGDFLDNVPAYVDQLTEGDNAVAEFVKRYNLDAEIEEFGQNLANNLRDSSGRILSGIGRVGVAIVSILTVLVLTFFMLVEGPYWIDKFWKMQPKSKRAHRQELAHKMYKVITGYVNGQLLIALLAGLSSLVVMLLLGIPFALPLAGIVGLFGLIPLVGATLASVIVILVALLQSVYVAITMAVFFLLYQQVENNLVQPYVQSRTLEVSPLLVLIAVIFGITVGGLLGGLVAIPLAAIARILILDRIKRNHSEHHKDDHSKSHSRSEPEAA